MSHTPTPWTLTTEDCMSDIRGDGLLIASLLKTDAAFIVKAVNAHDDLVETLKRILKRATPHPEDEDFDRARQLRHIKSHCEAALAKAGLL